MVVYKAYHKKYGWTRDYKREDGQLLFDFGKGYVKCNDYCVGFKLLDDGDENSKQIIRDKKIAELFDEDNGCLFTKHLYKYPKNLKISYYELEEPYFFLDYNNGVFQFNYNYNGNNWIPISYVDEISRQYINLEELELIGNKLEDYNLVRELFYAIQ